MIGERHGVEQLPVVVHIEGRPTAVLGLHVDQPVDGAALDAFLGGLVRGVGVQQSEQNYGRVVDVGIMIVFKLESPSGGLQVGPLHAPVALVPDLALQQPVGRRAHPVGRRAAHFAKREHGVGRVPDGRKTGLKIQLRLGLRDQFVEVLDRFDPVGMILGVAQAFERHDQIHHRRINCAEALRVARVIENPFLSFAEGLLAQRLRPAAFPQLEAAVDPLEDQRKTIAARLPEALARDDQFFKIEAGRHGPGPAERLHDGQRHDDGARPRRHFVQYAAGQQHQFGRDRGHVFARVQPEQTQVDFGVRIGRLDAAHVENGAAQPYHRLTLRMNAG